MTLVALGRQWMPRCIELAQRGAGRVSPNPMVGCVVLDRRGRLVGEGYHKKVGGPHAEVEALRVAGKKARGGTLVVSLEPCNHHGRTPPCSEAIAGAGLARVVYGAADPIAGHAGGARALRRAGIEVKGGVLRADCEHQNRAFFTVARAGRPHVVAKAAASLDGKSASAGGESMWITSEKARAHGRRLRGEVDAICVGVETVLADDPQLTARRRGARDPLRVIFDSELRTPARARVLPAASGGACLIATSEGASSRREKRLAGAGAEILRLGDARPDVVALLRALAARGCSSLLVEGGPTLLASFVAADVVDELHLYQAGLVLGGDGQSWLGAAGINTLARAPRFAISSVERVGPDVLVIASRVGEPANRLEPKTG